MVYKCLLFININTNTFSKFWSWRSFFDQKDNEFMNNEKVIQ